MMGRPERRALLRLFRREGFNVSDARQEAILFELGLHHEFQKVQEIKDRVVDVVEYELMRRENIERRTIENATLRTIVVPPKLPVYTSQIVDPSNPEYADQDAVTEDPYGIHYSSWRALLVEKRSSMQDLSEWH